MIEDETKLVKLAKLNKGIIFIGMSGSGKTTIGKILSDLIGFGFIDSDRLIETKFGHEPLQSIVDSYPDKRDFLKIERNIIEGIRLQKDILATGGSTCYAGDALRDLGGIIVFLKIDWSELVNRLGTFAERGVIILNKSVKEEYHARQKIYENLADLIIDCNGKNINDLVVEIRNKLEI